MCQFTCPKGAALDDTVRTRWTVTVAPALLAEVGASQVMPLAVHLLP
jgi:ATP-dependent DNA helicase RecQ